MEVKILYLYYDLMNLYGESGNIRVLERHLHEQGLEVTVDKKSIGDDIDFSQYAFIYAGSGTERNQKIALTDFCHYREQVKTAVESGTVFLFTGNSFEMLGKSITAGNGTVHDGIGLADFTTIEHSDTRYTGDVICKFNQLDTPMVGFINKCSEISGVPQTLFQVEMGPGNAVNDKQEGWRYKNVFGTHLVGPILVKNPHFMTYMIKLIGSTLQNFEYKPLPYPYEESAYEVTLSALQKRLEK
jgi:CobQ-like glutamine amidotransferase family enzyme